MIKKISLLFGLTITFIGVVWSQGSQGNYLEAKRLYYSGDYISADAAFLDLNEDAVFGPYSDFYRALIQYQIDQTREAVLLWKQLLIEYPVWEKQLEVLYWLSVTYFQLADFENGLVYLNSYTEKSTNASLSDQLVSLYMSELDLYAVQMYQQRYPQLRSLAYLLAIKINQQPFSEQDRDKLNQLVEDFQLPVSAVMELDIKNIRKSSYDVAVVLPFVFDGLINPVATIRNTLVMDLYQGMQIAIDELKESDINIRIHSFDTYKEADTVSKYEKELKNMDLIIGPLYPGPIEMVKNISSSYQINMISPLTSNSSYIDGNPYAFMAKPSYETMARKLAEYVVNQPHKPSAFIYFSKDERDSVFAEVYKSAIEKDDIKVQDFKSVDDLSAKRLLDSLTFQYEYYYSKKEADSLLAMGGRFIKTRTLREEEKENELLKTYSFYELDENGNIANPTDPKRLLAYEMKYKVEPDTVGHILIVSRFMSLYNNFVSAKAARQDSMGLYGYSNWFDNQLVNYDLMDQVDARVAAVEYYDKESIEYQKLSKQVIRRYGKNPSDFHVQGYDLMTYLGRMLSTHGRYFQFGAYESGPIKGAILSGYDFPGINDNQVVPIIEVENYYIKQSN